ncbi:MAG: hypothetical protein LBC20_10265, partial [Planctomycetaceae bacterium]|nr:hypothetical protein [Planctomycetaceae bacterium]
DINAKNSNDNTPIDFARKNPNKDIKDFLLWQGSDVNAKDKTDKTATDYARENSNNETKNFLLSHGGKSTDPSCMTIIVIVILLVFATYCMS